MDDKDSQSSPPGFSLYRLLRRPLGLPIFEFFWVFVFVVGLLAAAVVLPMLARLLHTPQ